MSNISTTDARALFTKMLMDVYREMIEPTAFLRSFFPVKESSTKEISIEVMRSKEKIAVDVARGTDGNRNQWTLSTEKIFIPPYFREFFDATQLQLYDRLFGSTEISNGNFSQFVQSVAEKTRELQNKIERSYEKQCADVLTTGIVSLNQGININFKRKAESLVDLGVGNYWDSAGVDPATSLSAACKFLRQVGKCTGGVFNAIVGDDVLALLVNNAKVQERGKIYNYALDLLNAPQRNSVGATFHRELTADTYRVRIYAYSQFFDNAANEQTPYLDPKKVIVLPENPRFMLSFAAVPQLLTEGQPPVKGAFVFSDYINLKAKTHEFHVESAGVAVPTAVDQIYTFKAIA